jgi:hypothetical protein
MEVTGQSAAIGSPSISTAGVPTRFAYTCWHSEEQHRCVKIRHQTWNMTGQQIGDEVVQLLGFQRGR